MVLVLVMVDMSVEVGGVTVEVCEEVWVMVAVFHLVIVVMVYVGMLSRFGFLPVKTASHVAGAA